MKIIELNYKKFYGWCKKVIKKVAIILATFNGERYLKEQLDSLCRQTYCNIDVYVHDDMSADNTMSLINEYIEREYKGIKFIFVDQSKLGYPQCFIKTLLSIPLYDYYAFCDQDDVWFDNKIEKAIKALEAFGTNSEPSLYYAAVDYYDSNLNYIRGARFVNTNLSEITNYSLQDMLLGGEAMGMTFLFNNRVRDALEETVKRGGNDFKDTFIKLYCAACGNIIYSYFPCAKYRRHSGATTVKMNPAGKLQRTMGMIKKIFIDRDGLQSIQQSVDFIYKQYVHNIKPENIELISLFSSPSTFAKKIKKVFWRKRFRLRLIDEIGYRVAFLIGRI